MTEFNIADYQIALDAMVNRTDNSNILGDYGEEIKSALTRCAAEPVDAGELDAAIAELYAWRHTDGRGRIPLTLGQRTALLEAAKAHRASLSNVISEDGNA